MFGGDGDVPGHEVEQLAPVGDPRGAAEGDHEDLRGGPGGVGLQLEVPRGRAPIAVDAPHRHVREGGHGHSRGLVVDADDPHVRHLGEDAVQGLGLQRVTFDPEAPE